VVTDELERIWKEEVLTYDDWGNIPEFARKDEENGKHGILKINRLISFNTTLTA
jgi:hypothetical protein